jgi:hypothetical protein
MTNEEILAQPNHLERRALMALNILREAAGLEPLSDEDDPAGQERIRQAKQRVAEHERSQGTQ